MADYHVIRQTPPTKRRPQSELKASKEPVADIIRSRKRGNYRLYAISASKATSFSCATTREVRLFTTRHESPPTIKRWGSGLGGV